jgi:hypothetical protein
MFRQMVEGQERLMKWRSLEQRKVKGHLEVDGL